VAGYDYDGQTRVSSRQLDLKFKTIHIGHSNICHNAPYPCCRITRQKLTQVVLALAGETSDSFGDIDFPVKKCLERLGY
jgi:hypothetical protein